MCLHSVKLHRDLNFASKVGNMNENLRSVLITIAVCVFMIFGYMQRENFSLRDVSPIVTFGLLRSGKLK